MPEQYPSRVAEKIVVRLPDGMRARLTAAAKSNNRSVNAEVVALLETFFPPSPTMERLVSEIEMTISAIRKEPERPILQHDLSSQLEELRDWLQIKHAIRAKDVEP